MPGKLNNIDDGKKKWKMFEELVYEIQRKLSNTAEVKHNDYIIGKKSNTERQIDVSIRQKIGQYEILIIIDCKDYSRPVDLNGVESFIGLVEDVQANKGALVSSSGFTINAKSRAEKAGIDLFRLVDTGKHAWQSFVSIPILCDFRRPVFNFRFFNVPEKEFKLPGTDSNILDILVFTKDEKPLGKIIDLFVDAWNQGKLSDSLGEHTDIDFIGKPIKINYDGKFYYIRITTNYIVKNRLYFGELPIKELSGFSDEIKGGIITKEFTTDYLDTRVVEKEWKLVRNIEDLAIKPVAIFMAVDFLESKYFT